MITRTSEDVVPGVTVDRILEFRSVQQTIDEDGLKDPELPGIGQRALDKASTSWAVEPDMSFTDDYHSGLYRSVPLHQSNFLKTPQTPMDSEKVWNERAVSICIAQELAIVAEMLNIGQYVEGQELGRLSEISGLDFHSLKTTDARGVAVAILAVAIGCNILLNDPECKMRGLMANGNVVGFLNHEGQAGGALIVSSFNIPCTKPGKRLMEIFPVIGQAAALRSNYPNTVRHALDSHHGWLGGVFSPGPVGLGDKVFVNQAPTTPSLARK